MDLQFDEDKHKYFTRGEGILNMDELMLMAYLLQLWRHRKYRWALW